MAQHASKSSHLQLVDFPKTVAVQVPLPVLGALGDARTPQAVGALCSERSGAVRPQAARVNSAAGPCGFSARTAAGEGISVSHRMSSTPSFSNRRQSP